MYIFRWTYLCEFGRRFLFVFTSKDLNNRKRDKNNFSFQSYFFTNFLNTEAIIINNCLCIYWAVMYDFYYIKNNRNMCLKRINSKCCGEHKIIVHNCFYRREYKGFSQSSLRFKLCLHNLSPQSFMSRGFGMFFY